MFSVQGHDTTAAGSSFFLCMMAARPDIQVRFIYTVLHILIFLNFLFCFNLFHIKFVQYYMNILYEALNEKFNGDSFNF